jgi:hypothetical protein
LDMAFTGWAEGVRHRGARTTGVAHRGGKS